MVLIPLRYVYHRNKTITIIQLLSFSQRHQQAISFKDQCFLVQPNINIIIALYADRQYP
jgi:ABC-type uncharacterized transport system involved in gliding motility auxiliary subunit